MLQILRSQRLLFIECPEEMFPLSYQSRERLCLFSPDVFFPAPEFGLFDIVHLAFNSNRMHFSCEQTERNGYPNCTFHACRVRAPNCHEYRCYCKKAHCHAWALNCPTWAVLEPYEGNERKDRLRVKAQTRIMRHRPERNRNSPPYTPSRSPSHGDG